VIATAPRFLDTNILLRYLTADHPERSPRAAALLHRVERGEERVVTSSMVIFELVFTLQHSYRVPRDIIRQRVLDIINLRGFQLPAKRVYGTAFDFYVEKRVSFADAFNAAYMDAAGITEVYSWDADFDKLDAVHRLKPSA